MCNEPDGDNGKCETVFDEEVAFPGGLRFAVQVCATTDPATEECWTQGVLFTAEGHEIGCTEVGESLLGEFTLDHDGDILEVTVITDMHTHYPDGKCPDCGANICRVAVDGDECKNCGHVYYAPKPVDDLKPFPADTADTILREMGEK